MFKQYLILLVAFFSTIFICSCSVFRNPAKIKTYAQINTTEGSFIIGLYEGTPLHKDNFIKNCTSNSYDSTLIYSTNPNGIHKMGLKPEKEEINVLSRTFKDSKINSEINAKLINKKGAVGMLKLDKDFEGESMSDNYLFYIVDGIKTDTKLIHTLEAKQNAPIIAKYIDEFNSEPNHYHYKDSLLQFKMNRDKENFRRLYLELTDSVKPRIKKDGIILFKLTNKQIEQYTKYGGIPIYDGHYTVFGEIVDGIEILSILSNIKTGIKGKPKKDIYILSTTVLTKKEYKHSK